MSEPWLVAVMGPTASGKTALAEALADATGYQLINADAFQIYRRLDIGTAKSHRHKEYRLMDIMDPWESSGAGDWILRAVRELEELFSKGRGAILVGGTLYYIRALFEGYSELFGPPDHALRTALNKRSLESLRAELLAVDPETKVDLDNRVRVQRALERREAEPLSWALPPFQLLKFGLEADHTDLRQRIGKRVDEMLAAGWLDEVAGLPEQGVSREDPGMRAHGYRALWDVAHGKLDLESARAGIVQEVAQYAKRQRTWLRAEPNLVKLPRQDEGNALASAMTLLLGDS